MKPMSLVLFLFYNELTKQKMGKQIMFCIEEAQKGDFLSLSRTWRISKRNRRIDKFIDKFLVHRLEQKERR